MSINIRFKCGHASIINEMTAAAPICSCGERQIAMVHPNRMPRFTGTVTGPYAEYKALDPGTANLAPAGPLRIKERT